MHDPIRASGLTTVFAFLAAVVGAPVTSFAQERVALSTGDSHPLVGTFQKPTGAIEGGVVLLPAAKSTRVAFDPLLPKLAQAGIAAITIEPRYVIGVESRPADGGTAELDLAAAVEFLVEHGIPADKIGLVGAGAGATLALEHAGRTGGRIKALVLLSPGKDDAPPSKDDILKWTLSSRPTLIIATADEAAKGAAALKEALTASELQTLEDRLASATGMFGRVPGVESTIADWLDRTLAMPQALDVGEGKLVFNDGEVSPSEVDGTTTVSVPLGDGTNATVRMSRSKKTLDIGFDMPEPYVRLNEVTIYVDPSGRGGRVIDEGCYRVSFNPKNPARKPILVQRGGLKGFEDSDEKGVVAHAKLDKKRHWSAEVSLDRSRFLPGDLPKTVRLAFQINGQRVSDIRYFPNDAKVPTTPSAWAVVNLR
jgi:pimeloyl-ACP methyl ester carboxylesterase